MRAAQVYSQSASGAFVAALLMDGYDTTDVAELLPHLQTPTLVLHWTDDPMFSSRLAQDMATKMPMQD